jgi:hypothetical protein
MVLSAWRQDYNTVRPHSKLGGMTPLESVEQHVSGHAPKHVVTTSTIKHEVPKLSLRVVQFSGEGQKGQDSTFERIQNGEHVMPVMAAAQLRSRHDY